MNRLLLLAPRIATNRLWARAGEVPSFHIAPARTQNARDLITGSVIGTYNSASPAWAVGSDGVLFQPAANAPVIEYDPVTLQCLGARIWGAVTNQWLYTSAIGTAPWSSVRSTSTLNAAISPDGTLTATRLTEDTSASTSHLVRQDPLVSSGTTYCWSVFAKASTRSELIMAFGTDSGIFSGEYATFNLSTGQITASGGTTTARISAFPNGWYRCSVTATALASNYAVLRHNIAVNGSATYTGDGTSSILLWGAQLNTGPLAPYVPTTTTTASSTADAWSITGADFSRIYNQSAVTFYAEATRDTVPGTEFPVLIDARTANAFEIVQCSYLTEAVAGSLVRSNNAIQAELYPTGLANIRTRRIAAAFAQDNFATCANGGIVLTDSSGTMPSPDRINLGSVGGGQFLNGYIREAAIIRSRRPNANLQAMTQ